MENTDQKNKKYRGKLNERFAILQAFIHSESGFEHSEKSLLSTEISTEELKKAFSETIHENLRFTDLFFNAPVGYAILNSQYKISEINELGCKFLNGEESDLQGKIFSDFIIPKDNDAFQFFMKNLKAGKPNVQCELKLKDNSDSLRIFGASGMEKKLDSQTYRLVFFKASAYSDTGANSDFHLDTSVDENDSAETASDLNRTKYSTDKILESLTILVADDDEVTRFYLSELLEQKCRKMFFAKNGKEAFEIFQNNQNIDLILMDIKMPVLDGYSATIKIKETDKKVVVVAQTAYALASDREKALAAGCDDYLAKPLMKKDLYSVIEKFFK
ncbi:response regulator [Mariniphaga sp.]|uniref:response regulator n=1 Tax=Mariniphaga sp. TaxID=1954475 RepID=UPI00356433CF